MKSLCCNLFSHVFFLLSFLVFLFCVSCFCFVCFLFYVNKLLWKCLGVLAKGMERKLAELAEETKQRFYNVYASLISL